MKVKKLKKMQMKKYTGKINIEALKNCTNSKENVVEKEIKIEEQPIVKIINYDEIPDGVYNFSGLNELQDRKTNPNLKENEKVLKAQNKKREKKIKDKEQKLEFKQEQKEKNDLQEKNLDEEQKEEIENSDKKIQKNHVYPENIEEKILNWFDSNKKFALILSIILGIFKYINSANIIQIIVISIIITVIVNILKIKNKLSIFIITSIGIYSSEIIEILACNFNYCYMCGTTLIITLLGIKCLKSLFQIEEPIKKVFLYLILVILLIALTIFGYIEFVPDKFKISILDINSFVETISFDKIINLYKDVILRNSLLLNLVLIATIILEIILVIDSEVKKNPIRILFIVLINAIMPMIIGFSRLLVDISDIVINLNLFIVLIAITILELSNKNFTWLFKWISILCMTIMSIVVCL